MENGIRTNYSVVLALTTLLFLVLPAPAQDGGFAACVRDAAQLDLAGKVAFQEAVRDLIAAQRPEFEPLANLHTSHQIALARARAAKIACLAEHDPGRIDTGSLSEFRNFDWSPADDAALTEQDPEAAARARRIAELRKKNDAHRDWPKLRKYMRAELFPGPEFRGLMAEITENDRAVRKSLKDCRRE